VWAVYEPLTYHRTAAMLEQFADMLATADAVAIADIWASRDRHHDRVGRGSGPGSRPQAARDVAAAPGSVEATAAWLAGEVRSGDVVLIMAAQELRIAELLVQSLSR